RHLYSRDYHRRGSPTPGPKAAPLDTDLLERGAVEDLHARFDLDLWQRNVERLADELLHALVVGLVQAEEQGVRRLVSADGQALVQHVLGDRHGRDRHLGPGWRDRKSTRLNSSHDQISY